MRRFGQEGMGHADLTTGNDREFIRVLPAEIFSFIQLLLTVTLHEDHASSEPL